MQMMSDQAVRKRRVFYIPGYDPFPPRRYRELYRKEGRAQADISGYQIGVTANSGDKPYGWQVDAVIDEVAVTSDIQVLVWADIVQSSMSQSIWATYVQMARTVWIYATSGALRRLTWLRKGPVIAALYPIGMLMAQLLVAVLLALLVGRLLALLHPFAGWVGIAIVPLVLMLFRSWDNRLFAYYLMHDYAYSAQVRGGTPAELQIRMDTFRDRIESALCEDVDEVLVVGHSSGAHLAVSILADLIRRRDTMDGPELALLTLGQVVPMVSFLPAADELRRDLHQLSLTDALTWVDVTAPGDGCAFALCDPVAVSGVATQDQKWPLVLSAAFTNTLQPETWAALRWKFFRLHFQYLCAFDRPGSYDYFQITAGPMTLAQRFDGRTSSKSQIRDAASKYTSMAV